MALHQRPATPRTTCPRQLPNRSGDSHLTGGPIDVGTGLSLGGAGRLAVEMADATAGP